MFSRFYSTVVGVRNSLYERGVFKSHSLGAKTVSIGNITVGGTGKTPLVAFAAKLLAENGEKVCILTRGYGRRHPKRRVLVSDGARILTDVENAGDEPFELANKLLGKAAVVADANRVAAGLWAREKFGITAFVLDDAFQHLRAERDLDIVCVDANNPFGNGKTLPNGILREPLRNLRRADAVVITRANLVRDLSNLQTQISKYNPVCPIFAAANRVSKVVELKQFLARQTDLAQVTSGERRPTDNNLAFCALGNPNNFFEQLRQENFALSATETFPDHHFYTPKDIAKLMEKAGQADAKVLLTTAKDAVKLKDLQIDLPCYVVESELVFSDEGNFRSWILAEK
ncbi:MAG: tetraacyldisaccharide 4'-kinase [Pyrinomonadaceae bacterium]|nr:tetraacyldisaccharide 4'-kinase [Pyrinomonadaceae bacterium]